MNRETKPLEHPLAKAQLWQLENGYVLIDDLGPRHVHYKLLTQPSQRLAATRMIRIEGLMAFLAHQEAKLLPSVRTLTA
jgi:hypothetical protein